MKMGMGIRMGTDMGGAHGRTGDILLFVPRGDEMPNQHCVAIRGIV